MKRILINATHNEEIRVALCKGNHMYDFDLENCTREQTKSNIYKAHVTRVEPSLEAVFVEYGAERQGFLPIREIAKEYLAGNPRNENIRNLIKEGDTLIVQVEKEERGNKGAALSTFISLAGRYLVLMPNNPRGGGISRQISGKNREEMKRIVSNLQMPKGMSVIIRTAGIGKSQEDLQHDLNYLLKIWESIGRQNQEYKSPRLVHQEAGVVTRALRDYMRDDIAEIWIDSANAYDEAVYFIESVMPKQLDKVRKYTDLEPMFSRFGIEKQIETTYQREVRLPAGGSIVIDQTEAMVAIDINSAKSTKGSDVAETAYHTNLEAAEEIARQLRLRDMGGLVVIDFIDMYDSNHQKEVTKRLIESTKFDRARVQFGEISKFGLMEMSRQRLRPSLEESTAYTCPRCHGTGMIRDIRSLSLAIVRQIEQLALTHRQGEIQAEVPTDIAAFILNEKRDTLVYLEQDSGARITVLPHAHLESPQYHINYKPNGFAPASYERINNSADKHTNDLGYEVDWQMADSERPEQQPTRQPKKGKNSNVERTNQPSNQPTNQQKTNNKQTGSQISHSNNQSNNSQSQNNQQNAQPTQAVAWLSNLFAPTPQAQTVEAISSQEAARAIEAIVNNGGQSLGSFGQVDMSAIAQNQAQAQSKSQSQTASTEKKNATDSGSDHNSNNTSSSVNSASQKRRTPKHEKGRDKKDRRHHNRNKKYHKDGSSNGNEKNKVNEQSHRNDYNKQAHSSDVKSEKARREPNSRRQSRGEFPRGDTLQLSEQQINEQKLHESQGQVTAQQQEQTPKTQEQKRSASSDGRTDSHQNRQQRNEQRHSERSQTAENKQQTNQQASKPTNKQANQQQGVQDKIEKSINPNEVSLQVSRNEKNSGDSQQPETVHLSLDNSKESTSRENIAKENATKENSAKASSSEANTEANKTSDKAVSDKTTVASTANTESQQAEPKQQTPVDSVNESANKSDDKSAESVQVERVVQETDAPQAEPITAETETTESQTAEVAEPETTAEMVAVAEEVETPVAPVASTAPITIDKDVISSIDTSARMDGRASNDPRVVLEELAKKLAKQLSHKESSHQESAGTDTHPVNIPVKAVKVIGTVGEFLRHTLEDAEERIQSEGVIASFIEAMAKIKQHQESADSPAEGSESNDIQATDNAENAIIEAELNKFDFSNYGYQPLSADYVGHFRSLTKPVGQFHTLAGKTETTPRAIGERASNDPRGQHIALDSVDDVNVSAVNADTDNTGATNTVENVETEAVAEKSIAEVLESELTATAKKSANIIHEIADDFADAFERLLGEDLTETADDIESSTVEETVNEKMVNETTVDNDSVNDDVKDDSAKNNSDRNGKQQQSQEERNKTTFDKYKSMLANVSNQLSAGQTGTNLFLNTPIVPKTRSRKKD